MQIETVIAGFGGQGVLFTGKVLAYAAMADDLEVTWFPSYGPEMRGGTANCTVIFADEEIGSPQVLSPRTVIAMNQPSLDKYEPLVQKDGFLVVNTSMLNRSAQRKDVHIIEVPGTKIAEEIGDKRLANIVLVGSLVQVANLFSLQKIEKALKKSLEGKNTSLLDMNIQALQKGADFQS